MHSGKHGLREDLERNEQPTTDVQDLSQFSGIANYLRKYGKNYDERTTPMSDLLMTDTE